MKGETFFKSQFNTGITATTFDWKNYLLPFGKYQNKTMFFCLCK